jgi:ABC-type proline/glycine betaine transport system ATPase subunit
VQSGREYADLAPEDLDRGNMIVIIMGFTGSGKTPLVKHLQTKRDGSFMMQTHFTQ